MGRAVLPRRPTWSTAEVVELVDETAGAKTIVLDAPEWPGHHAGQHVDLRLTLSGGSPAQRSYSIASAPEDGFLVLTVERLEDGEVSRFLVDALRPGDELELRGPVGEYFVWEPSLGGPLLLVGGGSGIVPLRAMLRHHARLECAVPVRLLYSARTLEDVIYRDELARMAAYDEIDIRIALTRGSPDGWRGYRRRIDRRLLEEVAWPPDEAPLFYVSGPTGFVDAAAASLVELGHDPARIRAERFGAP
jgi:ferredoxin-NADP reductase